MEHPELYLSEAVKPTPFRAGVGDSLVEAAQKLQAALLVLGSRGMGGVKRCVGRITLNA